jgi:cellulose 1,4-beta-cellobiosidase
MVFDEVEFYGTVTYVPRTAPATPTGLAATGISKGVTVTWNAVTGALSYNLYTSTDGVTYTLVASGITPTSRTVTGLTPNSLRYFKVQASSLGGVSAQSAAASATTLP